MKKHNLLALLASVFFPASLLADTLTLGGNTFGGPLFVRPTETGARSFFAVPYQIYQFNVTNSGAFTFTLTAADPSSYDTFMHLFAGAFDPADLSDPATNFLAANDDRDFNNPGVGSGLTNFTLSAGTNYFFVVDGFAASDAGAFTAGISGPGAITVVPEPSTIALLSVAAVVLLIVVGRHGQNARA